jgi:O-acetyl-ADP-ribose deacetylase (regulator of RNase III)
MVRLEKGDITQADADAIVLYAREDLKLGSGYGNAISIRGGPVIKQELEAKGTVSVGEAVVTTAGNLKAKYVIHAVGPKFQEADLDSKLKRTILSALQRAQEKTANRVAFPLMGAGFYGVSLDQCASVMIAALEAGLTEKNQPREVIIYALDSREYAPFQHELEKLK